MANGAFKFKDNSGNVVSFISGSGANISFSGGTLDLSGMTGLTLGNLTLSGTTQNAISASHAASYLLTSSFNTYSSSLATTGSNLFKGNQTISGSIIPAVDNAYDLGSVTHQFRDLYLSSASLYIDGTKVLGSTAQELQITTDTGQSFKILEAGSDNITLQSADGNIELKSSGGGDVILDPTTGVIALKGTTTLYAGNKILSSDGNAIQIGNSATITGSLIVTGFIETQELRTTYISSSILYRSGSTKFGDELSDTHAFTGSLLVSGTISVPDSGLVSGSSQVLNGSGVFSGSAQLPSGIVSSSAQTIANLPSGVVSGSSQVLAGTTIHSGSFFNGISVVSGSVQIDVMSTTNIARLATTGSNVFNGSQTVSGSLLTTSNIGIGVTPSAWSGYQGFQIGNQGSIGATSTVINFGQNVYYGASGNSYIENGKAAMYQMNDGVHGWRIASSGTTGNAISFTDAMTLNASGNLGLGVTDLGPNGMSLSTNFNYSWSEGSGNAYAVLFRQRNSAATVVASGYKRSNTSSFASSYGISMARAAIAVGYNNGSIAFFSDPASNVANGTDITPTERMTLNSSGNLSLTGNVTIGTTNAGQPTMYLTRVGGFPTIKGSTANGGDGQIVIDGASNTSNVYLNNYVASNVYLATGGGTTHSGLLIPHSNATFDLGSSANRWATVYTSDLSMSNGIGDYTIVEGLEDLFLYNNKTNKVFKFMLQEVNPSEATPKKS